MLTPFGQSQNKDLYIFQERNIYLHWNSASLDDSELIASESQHLEQGSAGIRPWAVLPASLGIRALQVGPSRRVPP